MSKLVDAYANPKDIIPEMKKYGAFLARAGCELNAVKAHYDAFPKALESVADEWTIASDEAWKTLMSQAFDMVKAGFEAFAEAEEEAQREKAAAEAANAEKAAEEAKKAEEAKGLEKDEERGAESRLGVADVADSKKSDPPVRALRRDEPPSPSFADLADASGSSEHAYTGSMVRSPSPSVEVEASGFVSLKGLRPIKTPAAKPGKKRALGPSHAAESGSSSEDDAPAPQELAPAPPTGTRQRHIQR